MRDQIAAAERAGLRAATINSTNVDDWSQVLDELRAGRARRAAGLPGAAGQPAVRRRAARPARRAAACWSSTRRTASPTGASTSGPTTSGSPAPCCSSRRTPRCWPPPPPPTSGSPPTSPPSSATDTVTLRGSLARASLRLSVVPGLSTLEGYAWVADALAAMPGSGIVYVLTVAETERLAGFLRDRGLDVAAYSGQTQNREELEDRLRAQRDQGAGGDLGARHGLRQARPGVLRAPRVRRRRRSPTTSRSAGPAGRWTTPSPCWSRARRTSGSGSTSPPPASRPTTRSSASSDALDDGPAEPARDRGRDRHPPRPAGDAAEDPGRRRRRRPRARRAGARPAAVGTTTRRSGPRCAGCGRPRPT